MERTHGFHRPLPEPVHPALVRDYRDLVTIYTRLRDRYQKEIDAAFDRVSRQIGFVVATTVPVVLYVGEKGQPERLEMGADHLKGTLFDRELSAALASITKPEPDPWVTAGVYNLYVIWFDALKLKLRTDWMEPAHVALGGSELLERSQQALAAQAQELHHPLPEPVQFLEKWREVLGRAQAHIPYRPLPEPVQWFDPSSTIPPEEVVVIEAIDEVYPELGLTERIATHRDTLRSYLKRGGIRPQ